MQPHHTAHGTQKEASLEFSYPVRRLGAFGHLPVSDHPISLSFRDHSAASPVISAGESLLLIAEGGAPGTTS